MRRFKILKPHCITCKQLLQILHPFNSTLDMFICVNEHFNGHRDCPRYRQPQGSLKNPDNEQYYMNYSVQPLGWMPGVTTRNWDKSHLRR